MKRFSAVAAALGLILWSTAAEAKIYAYVENPTYMGPYSYMQDIKLDSLGATSVEFKLPRAATVAITFSAECSLGGGDYAILDILIDDEPAMTSSDAAFCSSGGYVTASRTVAKALAKGSHVVKIRNKSWSSNKVQIDDTTLTIFD